MSLENTVKESQERSKKKKKQKISERHEESDQVVKNKKVKKRKEKFSSENDENNAVSMSHSKTKKHRTKRHSEKGTVEERKEDDGVTGDVRHSKARKRKDQSESQDGVKHVKRHQDDSGGKRERKRRERKDKFKDKVPEFLKLVKSKNLKEEEQPEPVAKTPEEIALEKMKEEKRERMKKKRQQKKANKGKKIESTVAKDAALAYLSQWHYHRAVWRFQKVRQVKQAESVKKLIMKDQYDHHHNVRPSSPGDCVWVNQSESKVVVKADTPRSYIGSTPKGEVRHNRCDLKLIPGTEDTSVKVIQPTVNSSPGSASLWSQDNSNSKTPIKVNPLSQSCVQTKSGRHSKPPKRLDL